MYMYKRYVIENTRTGECRTVTIQKGHHIPLKPFEKVIACCGGFNKPEKEEQQP